MGHTNHRYPPQGESPVKILLTGLPDSKPKRGQQQQEEDWSGVDSEEPKDSHRSFYSGAGKTLTDMKRTGRSTRATGPWATSP